MRRGGAEEGAAGGHLGYQSGELRLGADIFSGEREGGRRGGGGVGKWPVLCLLTPLKVFMLCSAFWASSAAFLV